MFPILEKRQGQRGGTLSGGEQQMLAIARALMARPRLLLLDEPSLGLAPLIVKQIFAAIKELNEKEGLTVFLVEQNAFHALKLAHRAYVMVNGKITMSGTGKELLAQPRNPRRLSRREPLNHVTFRRRQAVDVFLIMTVIIGGGAAFLAGRNLASRWRPWWMPAAYMIPLGLALRFFHYALFDGELLVAALFHHRHGGAHCGRLARLPADHGQPDGQPVSLGLRAVRPPVLAGQIGPLEFGSGLFRPFPIAYAFGPRFACKG